MDSLRQTAQQSGLPLNQVVTPAHQKYAVALEASPYRLPSAQMGKPRGKVDLDKAW